MSLKRIPGKSLTSQQPPPGLPSGEDVEIDSPLLSCIKASSGSPAWLLQPQPFLELQEPPCRTILQETAVICFADIRNTPRRELMGGNTRSLSVQRVRCGIYFILTVFNKAPGDCFYVVRSFSLRKKSFF